MNKFFKKLKKFWINRKKRTCENYTDKKIKEDWFTFKEVGNYVNVLFKGWYIASYKKDIFEELNMNYEQLLDLVKQRIRKLDKYNRNLRKVLKDTNEVDSEPKKSKKNKKQKEEEIIDEQESIANYLDGEL